jgi:adenylate cyclase
MEGTLLKDRAAAHPKTAPDLHAEARRQAAPIIDWLLEERVRAVRLPRFVDDFCRKLIDAGAPLDRLTLHMRQLHPRLFGRSVHWDREAGGALEVGREHGIENTAGYLKSPIRHIYEEKTPLRRRLEEPTCPQDLTIYRELRDKGYTDYTIRPLPFSTGKVAAVSFATRRPGGFLDLHIALFDALLPALATAVELSETRRTAQQLLNTYVGRNAGSRVLRGRIRRGDGERIDATIWYSDLRNFTALSETQPLDEVISLLNRYFECMAVPIERNGGEILKFIGDALLAIFAVDGEGRAVPRACERAMAAAREAQLRIAALNGDGGDGNGHSLRCGVALHVGEVMYGNIGAGERLDFTVIGPAVNLVTRLEGLSADLGEPIILSDTFVNCSGIPARALGSFSLKGIAAPQAAYAPL